MIWALVFIFLGVGNLYARTASSALSVPIFLDDGDTREPISISVGSMTAVSFYDVMTTTMPEKRIRSILVMNPSARYQLYIGTSSNFMSLASPKFWVVGRSSGSWITSNHQKFWMQYPQGNTEKVRGNIESE